MEQPSAVLGERHDLRYFKKLFENFDEKSNPKEDQTVKLDSLIEIDKIYLYDVNYLQKCMRLGTLDDKHRIILINWMIEVSEDLELKRDTSYTAIYFVDTFLSRNSNTPKHELQLLGVSALHLSAKKEVFKISEIILIICNLQSNMRCEKTK